MLKLENLKAIDSLKELSEDQLNAFVKASNDHETENITTWETKSEEGATRILDGICSDAEKVTGIARKSKQRTSDYLNEVYGNHAKSEVQGTIDTLTKAEKESKKTISGLNDQIAKGDNSEAFAKLKDDNDNLIQLRTDDEVKYKKELGEANLKNDNFRIDHAFKAEMPRLKEDLDAFSRKGRVNNAISDIKRDYEIKFTDDGEVVLTKDYKNYKLDEVLSQHPDIKEVLHADRNQNGGGAGGDKNKKKGGHPDFTDKLANSKDKLSDLQKFARDHVENDLNIKPFDDGYADKIKEVIKANQS